MNSRFFQIILIILMVCCLPGFAQTPANGVICTVYPVYYLSQELLAETGIPVGLLLPAELGCPHHYSLTPGDLNKLISADLIAMNGLGFEPFLEKIHAEVGDKKTFDSSVNVVFMNNDSDPPGQNPHVFSSPSGMAAMARNLGNAFASRFPEKKDRILENLSRLSKSLSSVAEIWASESSQLASTAVIITHESLAYSARDLKLGIVGKFGFQEEEGREPSAGEMIKMTDLVREKHPKVILCDDQHPDISALTISKETGVPILNWNTLVTGPVPAPENYAADKFMANLAILKKTLEQTKDTTGGGNLK